MTERVLTYAAELTREQQSVLADLATRLDANLTQVSADWAQAYRAALTEAGLVAAGGAQNDQTDLARTVFGALRQRKLGDALAGVFAWSRTLALDGMPYDRAIPLLHADQHSLMPHVLAVYRDAPEMPLVLDALDDWFAGAANVIGAAYLDAAQTRSADGARLNVLGQLAGGTAHALNNLLTAILGQTQLLIESAPNDEIRDELEQVQRTAAHGVRVVRRLQEFTRPLSADPAPRAEVNALLRDAAEITRFLWRDQAEVLGVVVDVVKDFADVPPVRARPAELRQVFVALILNAVEAMPQGGLITLRTERKGETVLVSIMDRGDGIAEGVRARMFEPFFTTKGLPHLGLGLSTAANMIAASGGTLTVASQAGRGSTLILTLPLAPRASAGEGVKRMSASRAARILVIDNEASVRDLLARLLKLHGHTVASAEDGMEGIAAFKREPFDLVLTDLGMPELSGWDVAREIKKLSPQVPIALTTGWPIDLEPHELQARGIDQVVSKPFDIPKLMALIDAALA